MPRATFSPPHFRRFLSRNSLLRSIPGRVPRNISPASFRAPCARCVSFRCPIAPRNILPTSFPRDFPAKLPDAQPTGLVHAQHPAYSLSRTMRTMRLISLPDSPVQRSLHLVSTGFPRGSPQCAAYRAGFRATSVTVSRARCARCASCRCPIAPRSILHTSFPRVFPARFPAAQHPGPVPAQHPAYSLSRTMRTMRLRPIAGSRPAIYTPVPYHNPGQRANTRCGEKWALGGGAGTGPWPSWPLPSVPDTPIQPRRAAASNGVRSPRRPLAFFRLSVGNERQGCLADG
jgi:hypothetical protein